MSKLKRKAKTIKLNQLKEILNQFDENAKIELMEDNSIWVTDKKNDRVINLQSLINDIARGRRWEND